MQDYFTLQMDRDELLEMSSLGLAHMGDAVYEILVRGWLCSGGKATAAHLHRDTVSMVCAPAQARSADIILPVLTDEEEGVYHRGRNAHVNMIPKKATRSEYLKATGLEALFGWLYLCGRKDRINELFNMIIGERETTNAL